MTRRIVPWFLGIALALSALVWTRTSGFEPSLAPAQTAASPAALAAVLSQLDSQIGPEIAKGGMGGASVAVVSGSKIIWSGHYGFADAEAKRVATNDSAYRIGSITKQFTTLALMQMVERDKMKLVEPVEKYVPEIKSVQSSYAYAPPITLLQVATMMSGLAREPKCDEHSVGPVSGWQKKVLDCLPTTAYAHEPGTAYLYSNIGYATLGLAIERAAGRPFITVVEEGILKPLGMTRSAFEPTPALRKDLAHGYQRRGDTPSREGPDRELDGRGYRVPNGALFSTINDLAKFVAWELGEGPDGILKKETQEANYMRTYSAGGGRGALAMTSGYGLGFMASRIGDIVVLGHGGSTGGYRASAVFHRPSKVGVIVLRNSDLDAGGIGNRVLRQVVGAVTPSSGDPVPAAAVR